MPSRRHRASTDQFTEQLDPSVVHALVPKPFDCEALIALVRNIIDHNRGRQAGEQ